MSISQSSLSTAYPAFMKAFGLGADTVAWLTTGFMLVMTLMIPVSPWLLHNVPFQRLFQAIELIFCHWDRLMYLGTEFYRAHDWPVA